MMLSLSRKLQARYSALQFSEIVFSRCLSSSLLSRFSLYKRISPLGDHKISIVPVLDEWIREGNTVTKQQLQQIIKELRKFKRFTHALEISQWMTDKMYFPPSMSDHAARLNLISRVYGLQKAEEYFNNIPTKLKGIAVYTALLNSYTHENMAEKAEELMQKMKELGFIQGPLCYNIMMNMYHQMNVHEKLDALMVDMEQNGIQFDDYTLGIRLGAYATASDIEGIEKTLEGIESNPQMAKNWNTYAIAASGFLKAKNFVKAIVTLKKCEERVDGSCGNEAFDTLLRLYAETGRKDELCRVWYRYKGERKVYNKGYMSMISSVLKLGDIELAETTFNQWESQKLSYDFRVPKLLVDAYCEKGLVEKAGSLLQHAMVKGSEPSINVFYCLTSKYLEVDEISKATGVIEKAISVCPLEEKPEKEILDTCLKYLTAKRDINGFDEFMNLLRSKNAFSVAALERLRNHISRV